MYDVPLINITINDGGVCIEKFTSALKYETNNCGQD